MANITNLHNAPIAVGGVAIPVGATAAVPDWDRVKNRPVIKTWIEAKIIAVDSKKAEKEAADNAVDTGGAGLPGLPGMPSAEDGAKDALIAELKALTGTERTRKTSLDSLQKQVQEAKDAAAAGNS